MVARIHFIILLLSAVASAQALESRNEATSEHTLEAPVSPIKATYADIFDIVSETRKLIVSANANTTNSNFVRESLRLRDHRFTVTLSNDFSEDDFIGAPEVAYSIDYTYHNSDSPISHVEIQLADYSRSISVTGKSKEHVRALHGLLHNRLRAHSSVGGVQFRIDGGLCLLILGWILVILPFPLLLWRNPVLLSLRNLLFLNSCTAVGVLLVFSVSILPWDTWLPGTAVFQDSASFAVRHSATIAVVGVIVTVILSSAGIAFTVYFATRKPAKDHSAEEQQNTADTAKDPKQATGARKSKATTKRRRKE